MPHLRLEFGGVEQSALMGCGSVERSWLAGPGTMEPLITDAERSLELLVLDAAGTRKSLLAGCLHVTCVSSLQISTTNKTCIHILIIRLL